MVDTLRNNLVKRWNYTEEHAQQAAVNRDGSITFYFNNGKKIKLLGEKS